MSGTWQSRTVDEWAASVSASAEVVVPLVPWTGEDVAEEAASAWEEGWSVGCRGGSRYFVSPYGDVIPLGEAGYDEVDFADAVWARIVEVAEGMLGNRAGRRRNRYV